MKPKIYAIIGVITGVIAAAIAVFYRDLVSISVVLAVISGMLYQHAIELDGRD